MKYLHVIFVIMLLSLAGACSKEGSSDATHIAALREDFVAANTYGIYQDGSRVLVFNKNEHQFRFNSSRRLYGIVHDSGKEYAFLTLDATPTGTTPVKASFRSTFSVPDADVEDLVLLRSDAEKLWMWSDSRRMGFLFPRFTE